MAERRGLALSELTSVAEAPANQTGAQAPLAARNEPSPIDRLLERVSDPSTAASPTPLAALPEPARLALVRGLRWVNEEELEVSLRSDAQPLRARVTRELDRELLSDAVRDGQLLLAEWPEREVPTVVGVVHTRPPSKLRLSAEEITLDASRELLLRSGSAALRLRAGGEVELVGSRISAVSRGVMRLVGRLLRLN